VVTREASAPRPSVVAGATIDRWLLWPGGVLGALLLGVVASQGIGLPTLLALAAGGAFVLVLLMREHLRLALLAWIPLGALAYPWVRFPREQPVVTFDRLWIPSLLLATVLAGRRSGGAPQARAVAVALGWLVVAITTRIALGIALGEDLLVRSAWVDGLLLPAGLFMAARRLLNDTAACRQLAVACTVAGAVLAVTGIAQRIWGFELASLSGGAPRYDSFVQLVRVSGPYSTPEVYGLSLSICFAATVYWLQARRGLARALGVVVAGLEVAAIGLTLFRAAWIACALILVATVTVRRERSARLVGLTAIGALLIVGSQLAGNVDVLSERLSDSSNIYGRFATYQQGLEIFRTAPLTGIGVNRFAVAQEQVSAVAVGGIRAVETAHSTYVNVLAEQGLLGFLPLLALTVAVWVLLRSLRSRMADPEDQLALGAFCGASLAYLVMSLTLTMWPYGSSNAFFLIFLGAAAGRADARFAEGRSP
jgi:O-antigen ligase